MRISRKSLGDFSEIDILCHCLWEMTYDGYSNKEVKKSAKELFGRVDKAIKEINARKV